MHRNVCLVGTTFCQIIYVITHELYRPDIRRALIRDSASTDPEHIGMELMLHMSRNWVPGASVTGELIGSTDVFAVIEHQSCKLEFWKVDKTFKGKHKQFENCGLG